jgi:hypothetical protein
MKRLVGTSLVCLLKSPDILILTSAIYLVE